MTDQGYNGYHYMAGKLALSPFKKAAKAVNKVPRRHVAVAVNVAMATTNLRLIPVADLDRKIEWVLKGPTYYAHVGGTKTLWNKEQAVQRQFTIELRVDYADSDKNDSMKQTLTQCARQMFATATLLSDGQAPDIAIFSEDFFVGKEVIDLMATAPVTGGEDAVSQELLDALKDDQKDKDAAKS